MNRSCFRWCGFLLLCIIITACDIMDDSPAVITESDFKQYLKKNHFEIHETGIPISELGYRLANGQKEDISVNRGSVILLNFWATWCFPCKQEMPDLEELSHKMKGEKFRILAVNSGENPSKVNRFLEQYPYSFDVILDEHSNLTNSLKVNGLPTTFILNHNLELIGKVIGVIDWKDKRFVNYLRKYSRT